MALTCLSSLLINFSASRPSGDILEPEDCSIRAPGPTDAAPAADIKPFNSAAETDGLPDGERDGSRLDVCALADPDWRDPGVLDDVLPAEWLEVKLEACKPETPELAPPITDSCYKDVLMDKSVPCMLRTVLMGAPYYFR